MARMNRHVVLLGDSVFDNGAYVPGDPAVSKQLRDRLGERVTMLAVDGDCVEHVAAQLDSLPAKSTHLVLSVGGNDALGSLHLMKAQVSTVGEAFAMVAADVERFRVAYDGLLEKVLAHGLPVAVCTIYDPRFAAGDTTRLGPDAPGAAMQVAAAFGLCAFNDVITRAAARTGTDVIDLRLIFDSDADYANPIEPSAVGGAKLVRVIDDWVRSPGAGMLRT